MLHFWAHHAPFGTKKNLFRKTINTTFMYHWPLSLLKIKKKSLEPTKSHEDASISGPKWSDSSWAQNGPFTLNDNFFRKGINIIFSP